MPGILSLIKRPRAPRRMHDHVLKTVEIAYNALGEVIVTSLKQAVSEWEEIPDFTVTVSVGKKKWSLEARVDKRKKIGKIFTWVDKGTAARSVHGGEPYSIVPKKAGGMLVFIAPTMPKTMPSPAIAGFPRTDTPTLQVRAEVLHPGIFPRNFTADLIKQLKDPKKVGGLKSVTEAAVKRAFRDIERGNYD